VSYWTCPASVFSFQSTSCVSEQPVHESCDPCKTIHTPSLARFRIPRLSEFVTVLSITIRFCSVVSLLHCNERLECDLSNGCPRGSGNREMECRETIRFERTSFRTHVPSRSGRCSPSDTYFSAFQRAFRQFGLGRAGSHNASINTPRLEVLQATEKCGSIGGEVGG